MKMNALQSIMLSIAEARSLDPILEQIVHGVSEAFDLALARLWLIQTDAECPLCAVNSIRSKESALHLMGSAGRSKSGRSYGGNSGAFHRIGMGDRKIGQIAQSGEPMLIRKVTGEESWVAAPEWIKREGIQSFAGQPLQFRGRTLGVLAVFSRSVFSSDDFTWLRTFADHAAVAIANAKAFEELDRLKLQLQAENEYLQEEIKGTLHFGEIIGASHALKNVLEQVALVAETTATVLIQGESGTGKELIARAIHERSLRRDRPFIRVNCAAIPEQLFDSEFFGHVKGAFTGAVKDRGGRFELAHTGDLFLDEVGEIPLAVQAKLLRVIQEKQFERVGEGRTRSADVRLICATNRDLKRAVEEGKFREDLFYRLSVFPIHLPPLRARKEDISVLATHFLQKSAVKLGVAAPRLTRENLRQLEEYDWPGNIRELENVIERAAILSRGSGRLSFELNRSVGKSSPPRKESREAPKENRVFTSKQLRQRETENILAALQQANGRIFGAGGAAELLGMKPTTLASRLKALGLKKTYGPLPDRV